MASRRKAAIAIRRIISPPPVREATKFYHRRGGAAGKYRRRSENVMYTRRRKLQRQLPVKEVHYEDRKRALCVARERNFVWNGSDSSRAILRKGRSPRCFRGTG